MPTSLDPDRGTGRAHLASSTPRTDLSEPTAAPSRATLLGEIRAVREPVRLVWRLPRQCGGPRGQGQPVLLVPGFAMPEVTMDPLRRYLGLRGFEAAHWGLGTNQGRIGRQTRGLVAAADRAAQRWQRPVGVVGWSFGGVLARELARQRPDLVSSVVTFGTPVVGGPLYTATAGRYEEDQRVAIAETLFAREQNPLERPVTVMWSRRDGVVAWQACLDRTNDHAEHVEVSSTHLGMVLDPDVWLTCALALSPERATFAA